MSPPAAAAPESWRQRVFSTLEGARSGTRAGRIFQVLITSLIVLNIVGLFLETDDAIYREAPRLFEVFDVVSVAIFTVEYLLRLWSCTVQPAYAQPLRGRLRYALTPMALVDLLAILPFYLPFVGVDMRFIRSLRMFRLLRLAKLARYSRALSNIRRSVASKSEELTMTGVLGVVLLICASSLIYFAEHDAQPDKFSSIPAATWWAVATLTTVGYGDIYPVTMVGKLISGVIAVLGIGMFALPASILGSAYMEEIARKHEARHICPHCGGDVSRDGAD